jgi:cytoskeletal protein CcmA (bactofilin family)
LHNFPSGCGFYLAEWLFAVKFSRYDEIKFLGVFMADNNQNGCLTVGEGVKLTGNFVVPDIASISGTIEGELTAREILVGSTGVLKGKVTADVVDVRGEIHDNLTANKSLFIRSTGKVIGTVQYAEIEIEKGGDLQGNLLKSANGNSGS